MRSIPRTGICARGVAIAALCVALAAGSAAAKLTNSHITLGQSIGSVRIGMTRAQVHRILGRPTGGKTLEVYAKLGLTVGYFRSSTAVTVGTNNPAYTTTAGIGPYRSTLSEVTAAYPAAHCNTDHTICDLDRPSGRVTRFTFNSQHDLIVVGVALAKYVSVLH